MRHGSGVWSVCVAALLPPPHASIPFPFPFLSPAKQQQHSNQINPTGFPENLKSQSRSSQSQLLPCLALPSSPVIQTRLRRSRYRFATSGTYPKSRCRASHHSHSHLHHQQSRDSTINSFVFIFVFFIIVISKLRDIPLSIKHTSWTNIYTFATQTVTKRTPPDR